MCQEKNGIDMEKNTLPLIFEIIKVFFKCF